MDYPHLTPELRRLTEDSLRLWGDAAERRHALDQVIERWSGDQTDAATQAIARVDRAVRDGLAAVRLPIAPGMPQAYRIVAGLQGFLARVDHAGTILAGDMIRPLLARGDHERVFRTWVHEGLHSRQPRSIGASAERSFRGYEEGLAEGLARLIVHDWASIPVTPGFFDFYVAAYRTLADTLGVPAENLWRRLWEVPPGEVRQHFPAVVAELSSRRSGRTLSEEQVARLRGIADRHFDNARLGTAPDAALLRRLWQQVLR